MQQQRGTASCGGCGEYRTGRWTTYGPHLQLDQRMLDLRQNQQSEITAVSFRTDAGASRTPLVFSGPQSGVIAVWSVQTKHRKSLIANAYDSAEMWL